MSGLLQDLRYAFRLLAKSPAFTAVAVLTLAIGIGTNAAIYSAVYPILFAPLPYPHSSRIVMMWDIFQGERSDITFHTFREVSSRSYSFDTTSALEPWRPTMTGVSQPERLEGQSVSADYFRVLGIAPALGRDFWPSDDMFHGPKVVILGSSLWQHRFGGNTTIVGHEIALDGDNYEIIGVMPAAFETFSLRRPTSGVPCSTTRATSPI
jgi:putative ABC transport system permease protein